MNVDVIPAAVFVSFVKFVFCGIREFIPLLSKANLIIKVDKEVGGGKFATVGNLVAIKEIDTYD